VRHSGFHGRAGWGERPALIVIDVNVGFTDPASPLVCDLGAVVESIARLLGEARRAGIPVVYTTVAYDEAGKQTAAAFIDKIPALLTLEAGSRWT
jgi:maleamate amidohydrolase